MFRHALSSFLPILQIQVSHKTSVDICTHTSLKCFGWCFSYFHFDFHGISHEQFYSHYNAKHFECIKKTQITWNKTKWMAQRNTKTRTISRDEEGAVDKSLPNVHSTWNEVWKNKNEETRIPRLKLVANGQFVLKSPFSLDANRSFTLNGLKMNETYSAWLKLWCGVVMSEFNIRFYFRFGSINLFPDWN